MGGLQRRVTSLFTAPGLQGSRLQARLRQMADAADQQRHAALRRAAAGLTRTEKLAVIGIDDWAYRRNHRDGTIVCDLERRRIVAVPAS